jgi:hypothetical protein
MFLQFDKFPKKLTPEEIERRKRLPLVLPIEKKALPLVRDTQPVEPKGTHCWWCVHPLLGAPLHLPFKYDDRTDRFTTTGEFCSWECMKAFALDMSTSRSGEIQSFIAVMRRKALGKYVILKAAPKRQALKIFGGTLSIEEFRRCSQQEAPVFVPYEKYICPTTPAVTVTSSELSADETLKLKRDKPLKRTASKLESALGITRKSK